MSVAKQEVPLANYLAAKQGGTTWLLNRPVEGCTHIFAAGKDSIPVVIHEEVRSERTIFVAKIVRDDQP